jgi:hypothetical protein
MTRQATAKQELELLRARAGQERARLLAEPPRLPSRKQLEVLREVAAAGGRLDADAVHFRVGLVLTARRWLRLKRHEGKLVFELTAAGNDVLGCLPQYPNPKSGV